MNELFIKTLGDYGDNNYNVAKLQIDTINEMNDSMLQYYKTVEEKIIEVANESEETNEEYKILEEYFSKIDKISNSITSLEETYDHLNGIVGRVDNKFKELEKLYSLLKKAKIC